ncbi:MAG: VOC family protein [Bacteroidetes bacterium]|nr:MAG: VOC family protein [Bacteroidota bacterium]
MLQTNPFLLFNGNCAEAMSFYKNCFGGELTIIKLGETPMSDAMPKEQHSKVAHSRLKSQGIEISATDWLHPTRRFNLGNSIAIGLRGTSYEELKAVFDKLAEGADKDLLDELKNMPFGIYGHLADKYGIHWFFTSEK